MQEKNWTKRRLYQVSSVQSMPLARDNITLHSALINFEVICIYLLTMHPWFYRGLAIAAIVQWIPQASLVTTHSDPNSIANMYIRPIAQHQYKRPVKMN